MIPEMIEEIGKVLDELKRVIVCSQPRQTQQGISLFEELVADQLEGARVQVHRIIANVSDEIPPQ